MAAAHRRVTRELQDLLTNPLDGCSVNLVGEDLLHWQATIMGPQGSPYEGGVFLLDIRFPPEYPFRSPIFKFTTRIYHPNIEKDGCVCLRMLCPCSWLPKTMTREGLVMTCSILANPDLLNPSEPRTACMWKTDEKQYKEIAKEWTRKYAMNS